jgi:hypothetical protein
MSFIEGVDRGQVALLPPCIDDYVAPDTLVRVVDAFVASLDLAELGFARAVCAATAGPVTGRPICFNSIYGAISIRCAPPAYWNAPIIVILKRSG